MRCTMIYEANVHPRLAATPVTNPVEALTPPGCLVQQLLNEITDGGMGKFFLGEENLEHLFKGVT